jgi:hypothetical protein
LNYTEAVTFLSHIDHVISPGFDFRFAGRLANPISTLGQTPPTHWRAELRQADRRTYPRRPGQPCRRRIPEKVMRNCIVAWFLREECVNRSLQPSTLRAGG